MTSEGVAVQHYSSLTMALDRGWVVNTMPQLHFLWEEDLETSAQEVGWAPGSVLTGANNIAPTSIQSLDLPAHSKSLY
jgi:hypothetical protein